MARIVLLKSCSIVPGDILYKKLTLIIAILAFAGPAWAQGSWNEIPCTESFLDLTPAAKCHKHSSVEGESSRAVGAAYATQGSPGGVLVSAVLTWPVGDGSYIKVYSSDDAQRAIRGQNALTRDRSSSWGELRSFADVSYMSFRANGRACVGFDDAGPLFEYGYAWRLVGFACAPAVDKPEAFVKAVLGALRVGPPTSSKSAMGEPIQPLSWSN